MKTPLTSRIRQAWQVLRGTTRMVTADSLLDTFTFGAVAGQRIAFETYSKFGIVTDPYASRADGAA